jgi:hypothetical protein
VRAAASLDLPAKLESGRTAPADPLAAQAIKNREPQLAKDDRVLV